MFLEIRSLDTYPFEVVRHHDCCLTPHSGGAFAIKIERDADNITTHYYCDDGDGWEAEIEIIDCDCEPPETKTGLDTRSPDEIPF